MIFKKLELINFKSHINTSIDFNCGISLIVGENGAGKSSIFEGISFALFKDSNVNLGDLVRNNKDVKGKIEMEVKLTFNSGGEDYRVERKVIKNNGNAKSGMEKLIRITDVREETIASKTGEVNREIEQIISMDSSTFLNAIHIKQGQISELFSKKPAERKELIGRLLKLDDLENAYSRIYDLIKEKNEESEFIKGKLAGSDNLKNQLDDAKKDLQTLLVNEENFSNEFNEVDENLKLKTKEKEDLDQIKDEFNKLSMEKSHQEDNLKKLNETKDKLDLELNKILDDEKEMENLRPYYDKLDIFNEFKESFVKFNNLKKKNQSKMKFSQRLMKIMGLF